MMLISLDRFIPLAEAAQQYGLTEGRLREMVVEGLIKAIILPGGEVCINQDSVAIATLNEKLQKIKLEHFEHLKENQITVTDASIKYGIVRETIQHWIRLKYVTVVKTGYPMKVDEVDVAYCTAIHNERREHGKKNGAPLLDADRKPYLIKHPKLSEYRRRKKQSPAW